MRAPFCHLSSTTGACTAVRTHFPLGAFAKPTRDWMGRREKQVSRASEPSFIGEIWLLVFPMAVIVNGHRPCTSCCRLGHRKPANCCLIFYY